MDRNLPKFEHDCSECLFLATNRGYDIYWCKPKKEIKARASNTGIISYSIASFGKLIEDEDDRPSWILAMMETLRKYGIRIN